MSPPYQQHPPGANMTVSGRLQAMGHKVLKPYRKMNKTSKVSGSTRGTRL